jgi:class 3 adenylate cyclase
MITMPQFSTLLKLSRSRLSRQIVFWVFLSIVLIEIIILIPSYYRRRQELLDQLQQVSREVLSSTMSDNSMTEPRDILPIFQQKLRDDSVILGGGLYKPNGDLVGTFGEAPVIESSTVAMALQQPVRQPWRKRQGDRFDVGWLISTASGDCLLVVRHDSSMVRPELIAFIWRIAGLVIVIAVFVTAATMLTLGKLVIAPILHLRDDMRRAEQVIGTEYPDPEFRSLNRRRQDELTEVIQAFFHLYAQVRQEIGDRIQAESALREEKLRSEELLLNILPAAIATQLKQDRRAIARRSEKVTILFADLVGFTPLSARMSPTRLVNTLNQIFSAFDRLVEQHGLEKIKTIGDAYMVAGGIPEPRSDHAIAIAHMALDMQTAIKEFLDDDGNPFQLRIGISTGTVVSGVIGLKKFSYDLWGNVVNIASRMESQGIPGKIQVTETTYLCLHKDFEFTKRGTLEVKGWGEMTTYFLNCRKPVALPQSESVQA